jgi:hypothetical protein
LTMGSVVVLREEVAPKRQTPLRRPNRELRTREHLTAREVERLIGAAKGNRCGHRDRTMILIAFRHARPGRGRWRVIPVGPGSSHPKNRSGL